MKRFSHMALTILFITTAMVSSACAAGDGSHLRGIVYDSSKAVITNATVTLKGANNSFTASTDQRGEYTFLNVSPDIYQLTVEKDTFTAVHIEGIVLDLNEVRALNVTMQARATSETVEVSQEQVSVVPQEVFLRGLVDPRRLKDLPLNGRNFSDLIYAQPGVARSIQPATSQAPNGSGHAVGGRGLANNFLMDGGEVNDPQRNSGPAANINTSGVPIDAIDELSVITANAGAEYGRVSGSTVNIVTKSGTDQLHGSLWEFLRNDKFDSRAFFDEPGQKEPFRQNQFGGRLGGAVAKKTYYSVAYEGFRQRQRIPTSAFVPTPEFLATITNPTFRSLLKGVYPSPNQPYAVGDLAALFNSTLSNARDQDSGFVRLDRTLGQAHRAYATMNVVDGVVSPVGRGIPGTGQGFQQRNWNSVISDNWTIRPTLYNTFHFSFNRLKYSEIFDPQVAAALQSGTARTAGPFAGLPYVEPNVANGFPPIDFSTVLFTSAGPNGKEIRAANSFRVQDSIAWIKSKHQFSFGADIGRDQINVNDGNNVRTGLLFDSSSLDSLQQGTVISQNQNFDLVNHTNERGFRARDLNFFATDTYSLLPRLTLDYGIRYEVNLPITEVHNVISNGFVMQNGKPLPCQTLPDGAGFSSVALVNPSAFGISPYCADKNNIAPRVGFAWDVLGNGKTIVRGAYGIFYDRVAGQTLNSFKPNVPFVLPSQLANFNYDGRQANPTLTPTSVFSVNTVDPALKAPMVQRWHLTFSRELTRDTVINTSYVGTNGNQLIRADRPNFGSNFADAFRPSNGTSADSMPRSQQDIGAGIIRGPFGEVTNTRSNGLSHYNALQIEILKRYSRGLTLQGAYTWSHSQDTASDDSTFTAATLNNMLAPLFAPGSSCAGTGDGVGSSDSLTAAVRCATGNNSLTANQAASVFIQKYIGVAGGRSDYGDSAFDIRHRFSMNAIYELPLGKDKWLLRGANGLTDKLVSGWQIASIVEGQTGAPLSINAGTDANFDGDSNDRAVKTGNLSALNFAGGSPKVDSTGTVRQYQCTGPADGCTSPVGQGLGVIDPTQRLGRGRFRAPNLFSMDASISKRTKLTERYSLQFRSEFFNVLNRVNFDAPASDINNPNFGVITNQLLINNTQSRQIQFGLKLEF